MRTLPDFKALSDAVVERAELESLLKEVYDKGYHAGKIDAQHNWWQDYDKSLEASPYLCAPSIHTYEDDNA